MGRDPHAVLGQDVDQSQGLRARLEHGLETGGLLVGEKIEITLEIEAVKAAAAQAA